MHNRYEQPNVISATMHNKWYLSILSAPSHNIISMNQSIRENTIQCAFDLLFSKTYEERRPGENHRKPQIRWWGLKSKAGVSCHTLSDKSNADLLPRIMTPHPQDNAVKSIRLTEKGARFVTIAKSFFTTTKRICYIKMGAWEVFSTRSKTFISQKE